MKSAVIKNLDSSIGYLWDSEGVEVQLIFCQDLTNKISINCEWILKLSETYLNPERPEVFEKNLCTFKKPKNSIQPK